MWTISICGELLCWLNLTWEWQEVESFLEVVGDFLKMISNVVHQLYLSPQVSSNKKGEHVWLWVGEGEGILCMKKHAQICMTKSNAVPGFWCSMVKAMPANITFLNNALLLLSCHWDYHKAALSFPSPLPCPSRGKRGEHGGVCEKPCVHCFQRG